MTSERSADQALTWVKSTYSGGAGGDCLEVAASLTSVRVRDSKDLGRGAFAVAPDAWSAFVAHARHAH
ncbi:DUF397 domain-containing protein [Streptomyces griseoincarnatus]|uniref:DUF397 domain-containing protein n=1 Tax=unclassified Streptomyces TaxID=2593676 RepID=UPI0018EE8933|nr:MULTISPECIES: DUF397 domain-containing protein [unclassified Streptomyces]MBJ6616053.1 DUF397 domain-containing protein [Streptomyces sp. I3(2020)]MBJ6626643.1 DUF397 domain-containing protein [Streptomyces sp. I4(2020)]